MPRPGQRRAGRGRPAPPLRAAAAATHSPVTGTTASRPPPAPAPPPADHVVPGEPMASGAAAAHDRAGGAARAGRGAAAALHPAAGRLRPGAPRPAALQRLPAAATGAEGPPPAGDGAERRQQVPGARPLRRAILPQIPVPAHLVLGERKSPPHNPELRSLSRILTRPCPAVFRTPANTGLHRRTPDLDGFFHLNTAARRLRAPRGA